MPNQIQNYEEQYNEYQGWYQNRKPNQEQLTQIQSNLDALQNMFKSILKDKHENTEAYNKTLNHIINTQYVLALFQIKKQYYDFIEYSIDLGHEIGHPFNADIQKLINQLEGILDQLPIQNRITNRLKDAYQNQQVIQHLINFVFLIDSDHIEASYTRLQEYSAKSANGRRNYTKNQLKIQKSLNGPEQLMYQHQIKGYQVLYLIRKQFEALNQAVTAKYQKDVQALNCQIVLKPNLKIKS